MPLEQKREEIKTSITEKLELYMDRPALPHEILNAEKDVGLIVQVLLDRIINIETRLDLIK